MGGNTRTTTTRGFSGISHVDYYYLFLLMLYIMSVMENGVVMALICLDQSLKTPKYIAVFNLAFVDVVGSSAQVPKVFGTFKFDHKKNTDSNCLTYEFFNFLTLTMQSLNLVVLSFDRLVAITFPLRYQIIVSLKTMFSLIAALLPVSIIWAPFVCIGAALAKISGGQDRMKAFKTCSAHIMLVIIYDLPILVTFSVAAKMPRNARIICLSIAAVIPPALNPLIYVLQTQEIKLSLKKVFKRVKQSKIALK
uniref:G-protein coupled receptors family 1 profile domain-containing protein n=1 Tax=Gadus morhua TaxID=8049 RepID=A0A8C5FA70_GADMO